MADVIDESMRGPARFTIIAPSIYHPFYHRFFDHFSLKKTDLDWILEKNFKNQKLN
ncbi:hypothetical protein P608_09910 [Comamonas thiooxydans]|uniref:Uncharacterized protein n=1 Tax=Comamonas thiooxydans TaxID=363952 RepID=A0A0E3BZ79_9BURK|nr:hypothetical protein P608_09910 [Comamonas thiooxydans]KGH24047.1 hypothetical protein P606_10125 [Comamonas thiooxydans]KGH25675.1 hypothetical protein P607_05500 [Comamonas thiooxydans]